ncbi:hypothetical protein SEA_CLARK_63 [Gordonia phage Clark]|uniref:Uncharacterized protein n=4 Tax=Beenievirus TaxID=3044673 RepID=A0A5P8DCR4_9CAUD|nr:hypothetical protein PP502_gp58 [Gordonia phage Beenie]YP_010654380.1 hypothetical protein PP506_gp58 [Gordonia phage DobbysSock]YP_010654458.1 hypothetical protein PP507_gp63 [Gordonia phage Clark]YP_010654537.1 membrane protein [Gordonia phage Samman98]AUV61623.1 hypothetical protein PBI_BEENIE_58 [Gordonia phage Beenie]QDF18012.1 hypothetical protein SEA_CLARK_63 [Gordonia phage Clark]QFP96179.1 hypothetical protein DOBBYSSOCK_SEA_58 [Gordonia phage DobbysSock]QYC54542.1 membrane prote
MRLAAATVVAFVLGFAVMFWRNARPLEHNTRTGTGADQ